MLTRCSHSCCSAVQSLALSLHPSPLVHAPRAFVQVLLQQTQTEREQVIAITSLESAGISWESEEEGTKNDGRQGEETRTWRELQQNKGSTARLLSPASIHPLRLSPVSLTHLPSPSLLPLSSRLSLSLSVPRPESPELVTTAAGFAAAIAAPDSSAEPASGDRRSRQTACEGDGGPRRKRKKS